MWRDPLDFPANAFGCFTGDCPHRTQEECDNAPELAEWIEEFAEYQIGDIVAGLEEWRITRLYKDLMIVYAVDSVAIDLFSVCKEMPRQLERLFDKNNCIKDWQPASTLPEEFSRMKFKILGQGVQRLGDMSIEQMCEELKACKSLPDKWFLGGVTPQAYKDHWNTLHPEHPYSPDQWSVWTKFELLAEIKQTN